MPTSGGNQPAFLVNAQTVRAILMVGAGGFVGSVCRYALSGLVHRWLPGVAFPVGTLAVNVLGCLTIGVLLGLAEGRQILGPDTRLFLLMGVLGGFTTFSTFSYETLALVQAGEYARSVVNVLASVVFALLAVWLGHQLGSSR